MSYYLSSNNHGSILVIPEEGDQVTALPAMPTVTIASPFLPSIIAPTTAAVAKDLTVATSTATTSSTSSVRRVSFRTNELEEAKTIASSLVDFADSDYDDDDDEEEEGCKPASIVCHPLQGQAATAAAASFSSAAPSSTTFTPTSAAPASAAPASAAPTTTSHTTCTRGLELKYSVPRQKRKFTILRSIVKNQRRCSWDQLGLLARKCNVWATHAARVQGLLDYQDASEAKALSRRPLPDMALYPLPLKDKRSSISSSSSSNKRQAEPQEQHAQQTRRVRTKFDPSSIPTKLHNLHNI